MGRAEVLRLRAACAQNLAATTLHMCSHLRIPQTWGTEEVGNHPRLMLFPGVASLPGLMGLVLWGRPGEDTPDRRYRWTEI